MSSQYSSRAGRRRRSVMVYKSPALGFSTVAMASPTRWYLAKLKGEHRLPEQQGKPRYSSRNRATAQRAAGRQRAREHQVRYITHQMVMATEAVAGLAAGMDDLTDALEGLAAVSEP